MSTTHESAIRWLGDLLLRRTNVGSLWAEARSSSSMRPLSFVFVTVATFMILILGQLTIFEGARLVAQSPPKTTLYGPALEALGIAVDENSFAVGIVLILLGGFAMGLPSATVVRPPLPRVQLEMNKESGTTEDDSTSSKGWLVAHGDGFWHLLLEESGELQSIPDGRVRVARTGEEGPTPPAKKGLRLHRKPPEEDAKPGAGEDG